MVECCRTLAIDPKLIVKDSPVRAAIPILPMPLATLCFVLNLLVPGFGKMLKIFEGNISIYLLFLTFY